MPRIIAMLSEVAVCSILVCIVRNSIHEFFIERYYESSFLTAESSFPPLGMETLYQPLGASDGPDIVHIAIEAESAISGRKPPATIRLNIKMPTLYHSHRLSS